MTHHRIGSTLVMDGIKLVGILSERDTVRAISQARDAPAHQVSAWMTSNPATVAPDKDTDAALRVMLDRGFRHLPVVEDGALVGIVSMRDLAVS